MGLLRNYFGNFSTWVEKYHFYMERYIKMHIKMNMEVMDQMEVWTKWGSRSQRGIRVWGLGVAGWEWGQTGAEARWAWGRWKQRPDGGWWGPDGHGARWGICGEGWGLSRTCSLSSTHPLSGTPSPIWQPIPYLLPHSSYLVPLGRTG